MRKIAFIGLGNMGRAIACGLVRGGAVEAANVRAYAPHYEKLLKSVADDGIVACRSALEAVEGADTVVVAVKPYVIEGVLNELRDALKGKALVSVALGYDFKKLSALVDPSTRVQFVMPNTPAMAGEGVLLFEEENSLLPEERRELMEQFKVLGLVETLPGRLMGIGGSISGCGPAFCAMVIEALGDAGVKYGLPRATAYRLASATLAGTGKLQIATGEHPGALKDAVCSPGGSTIRGVEALERAGLRAAMLDAVQAVMNYGKE